MPIVLRQTCLVAEHLAPVVADLSAAFSIRPCHIDPEVGKFGLENTLLAVGSQFLEVVAPTQANTAAGRFLARRGGDGGYMIICQVPSLDEQAAVRKRADENGVRVAYESDRGSWNIMQLHPADMGAAFFEVDWDQEADPTGNWQPAGGEEWRDHVATEVVSAIVAVELQSNEPEATADRWASVAGAPVQWHDGAPTVPLANAELRFVPVRDDRGAGLSGIVLRVADRARLFAQARARGIRTSNESVTIGGVRFDFVD